MNSTLAPQFTLEDREVTVTELLKLATRMFGTRAPQTSQDLFLRPGGIEAFEFIAYSIAVEETFRVFVPQKMLDDWLAIEQVANSSTAEPCAVGRRA
jgi:hypothetical protein